MKGVPRKRRIFLAMALALPLEMVNFFLLIPSLDVCYPPGTSRWIQLIGLQWALLHRIGLRASGLLEGSRYAILSIPVIFAGGYLEIALLLILAFSILPLIRHRRGKHLFTAQ